MQHAESVNFVLRVNERASGKLHNLSQSTPSCAGFRTSGGCQTRKVTTIDTQS